MKNLIERNTLKLLALGVILITSGIFRTANASATDGAVLLMIWVATSTAIFMMAIAWVLTTPKAEAPGEAGLLAACGILLMLTSGAIVGALPAILTVCGSAICGIAIKHKGKIAKQTGSQTNQ